MVVVVVVVASAVGAVPWSESNGTLEKQVKTLDDFFFIERYRVRASIVASWMLCKTKTKRIY